MIRIAQGNTQTLQLCNQKFLELLKKLRAIEPRLSYRKTTKSADRRYFIIEQIRWQRVFGFIPWPSIEDVAWVCTVCHGHHEIYMRVESPDGRFYIPCRDTAREIGRELGLRVTVTKGDGSSHRAVFEPAKEVVPYENTKMAGTRSCLPGARQPTQYSLASVGHKKK